MVIEGIAEFRFSRSFAISDAAQCSIFLLGTWISSCRYEEVELGKDVDFYEGSGVPRGRAPS